MDNNYFWSYSFKMKKGILDNDYYFYSNGKILHSFDKSISNYNIEKFVSAEDIPDQERQEMINECPLKFKEQIMEMLTITSK